MEQVDDLSHSDARLSNLMEAKDGVRALPLAQSIWGISQTYRYTILYYDMTRSDQIGLDDYMALAEFRYQIRCFLRSSEEAARQAGIEPQQHQLMLSLKGRPEEEPPRIAYLADRLQLQHHSAVELVDRLVKKGLIRRTRGAGDRREVHVQLTSRGEDVLERLTMHTRAELQTAAPALVAALRRLTVRIKPRSISQRQDAGAALMRRSGS